MNNYEINAAMSHEVKAERGATLKILNLINLAEMSKLPLEMGFRSTHDWLIRRTIIFESAANRRVQLQRLLKVSSDLSKN